MNEAVLKDIAYVNSQVACAMIEMQGMVAHNVSLRISSHGNPYGNPDASPMYTKKDFDELITKYNIYHNAVVTALHQNYG